MRLHMPLYFSSDSSSDPNGLLYHLQLTKKTMRKFSIQFWIEKSYSFLEHKLTSTQQNLFFKRHLMKHDFSYSLVSDNFLYKQCKTHCNYLSTRRNGGLLILFEFNIKQKIILLPIAGARCWPPFSPSWLWLRHRYFTLLLLYKYTRERTLNSFYMPCIDRDYLILLLKSDDKV